MTREAKAADRAVGSIGRQTERRIGWLTLVFGLVATAVVLGLGHKRWAAGLAMGTSLGWLNFRWLRRAVDALVVVATAQAGREEPKVPLTARLAPLFRYGLLGLAVYVIFVFLHVPLVSVIFGFCALAAATIAASVWEILRPVD
jgi:hypothetical protein